MPPIAKTAIRISSGAMVLAVAAACGSGGGEAGPYGGPPGDGDLGFVGSGGRGMGGQGSRDAGIDAGRGMPVSDGGLFDSGGEVDAASGGMSKDGGNGNIVDAMAEGGSGNVLDGGAGVGVMFNLPPGFFPSLSWVISGPSGDYSGTITFGDAQSIEFVVGGIEAGSGYVLEIAGTDIYGDHCSGASAPFVVSAGEVAGAGIVLGCSPAVGDAAVPAMITTGSVGVDAGVTFRDF